MKKKTPLLKVFFSKTCLSLVVMLLTLAGFQGCSVNKAIKNPSYKDLSILKPGTDRAQIIAELGAPVATIKENGDTVDIFKFKQGSHTTTKIVKGVGYTVLAIGTLGLSEVVLWPAETTLGSGANIELKAVYDENSVVKDVKIYRDDRWIKLSKLKGTKNKASDKEN